MYSGLAKELYRTLTGEEWKLVSYYINKADELGEAGKEAEAKRELENALAIAASQSDEATRENMIIKIRPYLRFY